MHACADKIIDLFSGKGEGATDSGLMSNPAKLCYVIKQAIREAAVGKAFFLMLLTVNYKMAYRSTSKISV